MIQPTIRQMGYNGRKKPIGTLCFDPIRSTNTIVIGKSYTGNYYGINYDWVVVSIDGHDTKVNGVQPRTTIGDTPCHLTVWPDGSVFIASTVGNLATMATYATVPTITQTGVGFNALSISTYADSTRKIVLAGEYKATTTAKKLFLSVDGGESFTQIKESYANGVDNTHWHGISFDPYRNRIWAAQGDVGNSQMYYSDDMGATWANVLGPDNMVLQPTLLYALRRGVVTGRDGSPIKSGIDIYNQFQDKVSFSPGLVFRQDKYSYAFYPSFNSIATDGEAVLYILFPNRTGDTTDKNYIYATGDGGLSWHCVFQLNRSVFNNLGGVMGGRNKYIFLAETIGGQLYRAKPLVWVDDN